MLYSGCIGPILGLVPTPRTPARRWAKRSVVAPDLTVEVLDGVSDILDAQEALVEILFVAIERLQHLAAKVVDIPPESLGIGFAGALVQPNAIAPLGVEQRLLDRLDGALPRRHQLVHALRDLVHRAV